MFNTIKLQYFNTVLTLYQRNISSAGKIECKFPSVELSALNLFVAYSWIKFSNTVLAFILSPWEPWCHISVMADAHCSTSTPAVISKAPVNRPWSLFLWMRHKTQTSPLALSQAAHSFGPVPVPTWYPEARWESLWPRQYRADLFLFHGAHTDDGTLGPIKLPPKRDPQRCLLFLFLRRLLLTM